MNIFIGMKVPRTDTELRLAADLLVAAVKSTGHTPFLATDEIARRAIADPQEFMPFVREHLRSADLVILLSPLYVDSFPAPVTKALESFAERRKREPVRRDQGFVAVLNCGFPEAPQNHTALANARNFALEAGFSW